MDAIITPNWNEYDGNIQTWQLDNKCKIRQDFNDFCKVSGPHRTKNIYTIFIVPKKDLEISDC